jgi:hypothetical protein
MAGSGEDPGKQFEASAGRPIQDTDISKSLCGCSRDGGEGAVLDEQVLILHDGHEQFGVERRPASASSISSSDWAGCQTIVPDLRIGISVFS